jgi:uncharacterized membrane protein YfcA
VDLDPMLAVAGLLVGFVVGLTGMGGGALMTPVLVIFFGVQPLAAVSSDLVASLVMKPIGGAVHARRGTVHVRLVGWLALGSVPAAFCGVLLLRALGGNEESLQHTVKWCLGVALVVAAAGIVFKAFLGVRNRGGAGPGADGVIAVRPLPTLAVGIVGGLVVGMTSVGSGSLIIVALLFLYPRLTASQIVGTDLVQAVPLVASAAVGHMIFGDFKLDLTLGVLLGAVPGVYLGARVSSRASQALIRRALVIVLLVSAAKLLGAGNVALLAMLGGALFVGPALWALVRHTDGFRVPPRRIDRSTALRLLLSAAIGRRPAPAPVPPPGPPLTKVNGPSA